MKKLVTFLSALLVCSSLSLATESRLSVGAGAGVSNQFYKGDSVVFPAFNVRYGDFFADNFTFGYDMYSEDDFTVSLFLNPLDGFPIKGSKMDNGYDSIDERKTQFAVGAMVAYDLNFYNTTAMFTISGGERGAKGGATLLKPYRVSENLTFIPAFGVNVYSSNYTDYYFGIDSNELDGKITETYSPSTAYSVGIHLATEYYLNDQITLLAFMSADKFSSEVGDSPIIDNSTLFIVGVGARYSF